MIQNSGFQEAVLASSRELSLTRWLKGVGGILQGAPKLSLLYLLAAVLCAIFAPLIAPFDPVVGDLDNLFLAPSISSGHVLGTDHVGRDLLSRIIFGARISVTVGFLAVVVSGFVGTVVGAVAGLSRGWVDAVLMQITDAFMSLPFMIIAVTSIALIGPSLTTVILIIGLLRWMNYARIIRSEVLRLSQSDFVKLATVAGAGKGRIILRHLFPNFSNSLLVIGSLELGTVVGFEAGLSFLGLGVPRPISSWGTILAESQHYVYTIWWLPLWPLIAIFLLILSTNLVGDWLRDRTDPTRRQL